MQVIHARPVDKGVTRLMYVGDDLQPTSPISLPVIVTIGVVLYLSSFLFRDKAR